MPLPPESLQVGQCYLSTMGKVRRVLSIHAERVLYETRGQANEKSAGFTWRPGIVTPRPLRCSLSGLCPVTGRRRATTHEPAT